jgi:hypothetical protein
VGGVGGAPEGNATGSGKMTKAHVNLDVSLETVVKKVGNRAGTLPLLAVDQGESPHYDLQDL